MGRPEGRQQRQEASPAAPGVEVKHKALRKFPSVGVRRILEKQACYKWKHMPLWRRGPLELLLGLEFWSFLCCAWCQMPGPDGLPRGLQVELTTGSQLRRMCSPEERRDHGSPTPVVSAVEGELRAGWGSAPNPTADSCHSLLACLIIIINVLISVISLLKAPAQYNALCFLPLCQVMLYK